MLFRKARDLVQRHQDSLVLLIVLAPLEVPHLRAVQSVIENVRRHFGCPPLKSKCPPSMTSSLTWLVSFVDGLADAWRGAHTESSALGLVYRAEVMAARKARCRQSSELQAYPLRSGTPAENW